MFESILPGWIAGVLFALITGPLGSFVIWRRMSSFGDTLSHSSFLGLAISFSFNFNSFVSIFLLISIIAVILACLEELLPISLDTILNVVSHSSLSLGMILISFLSSTKKIDLNNYFFGDLLKVTVFDLILITIGSVIILSILIYHWHDILTTTINEELAKIDGINLLYIRLIIMFMISLSISIAIKFVGSLLVTSLLVIPPSTAQHFSKSPEKMVFFTILISIISITGGICLSVYYNIPSSPAIVIFSTSLYFLSHLKKYFF